MKHIGLAPLLALLVILTPARGFAQALTLDDAGAYTARTLFSTSNGTGGFAFDSAGDIFYLGGPNGGFYSESELLEADAANYNSSSPITRFASPISGDFVTVHDNTIYYGQYVSSNSGPITAVNSKGSHSINVPGNYDLAFSGTTAFVSADVTGTNNEVYTLNTVTGAYKPLFSTGGDYSGPITFDAKGDLIYGASGAAIGGDIYVFSHAMVQQTIMDSGTLQRANAEMVITGPIGNSSLVVIGNELYDAYANGFDPGTLTAYNLTNGAATLIATQENPGYSFSAIGDFDGSLFVDETDGSTLSEFIDITPIPEPGAAWLGVAGLGLILLFRRRRARDENA